MAISVSRFRFVPCLFTLLLHFCFASAVERLQTRENGRLSLAKRAEGKTFEIPFDVVNYNGEVYGFNCSIGTPPQKVQLAINVFRSDTQVSMNITSNPFDTAYNITLSTSANPFLASIEVTSLEVYPSDSPNANVNDIGYFEATYASDNFSIPGVNGSATVNDLQFMSYVNITTNDIDRGFNNYTYNWISLGLATGQSAVHYPFDPINGKPYPTFAQHLMNVSLIDSNTYSIWLDNTTKKTGHLLMGGINSKRYKGSLVNLPTTLNFTSDDFGLRLQTVLSVGIDSVGVNGKPLPDTAMSNVVLAHSQYTLLSRAAAKAFWIAVGATWSDGYPLEQTRGTVPCSYLTNSSTIDLKFSSSNLTVSVPMSSITTRGGEGPNGDGGIYGDTCVLTVKAVGTGLPAMLGTAIMRNLYTVYDLTNTIVSVALTDFTATKDNVIAIPVEGVAGIKQEAFGPAETTTPSPSGSATPSGSNTASSTAIAKDEGSKKGVAVGLGVGIPVAAVLAFVGAFFLWRRRRAGRNEVVEKQEHEGGDGSYSKAELADDQKMHAEVMGNGVSEIGGGEGVGVKHELPVKVERQELPADQRHELP